MSVLLLSFGLAVAMVQGILCGPASQPDDERPSGPKQHGRGVHGQYVYWVTMPHPKPETITKHDVKCPHG